MDVTIESGDWDRTGVCDVSLPSSVHEPDNIANLSLADDNDAENTESPQLLPTCSTPKKASSTSRPLLFDSSLDDNAAIVDVTLPDSECSISLEKQLVASSTTTLSTDTSGITSIFSKILSMHKVCKLLKYFSLVEQWDILNVIRLKGCAEECATRVHQLPPGDIAFLHRNFSVRSQHAQNQWLLEYLNSNCSRQSSKPKFTFVVCGRMVCRVVWLAVLGVSQARFYRVRALYLEGKVTLDHDHTKKLRIKSNEAVAWMKNYFDR